MDILHVVQLYPPAASGAGRYFAEIGERLAREGHRVTVLATDAWDLEHLWAPGKRRATPAEEVRNGVRVLRLAVRRAPGPPLVYPLTRRLMVELSRLPRTEGLLRRMAGFTPRLPNFNRALAAAGRFDLVHVTNITLDFAIFPAFAYARRVGAAFLCTPFVHLGVPGDPSLVRYYSMRHQLDLLRRSDRVIAMTGRERDFLAARGVPAARLRVVGVGVEPAEVLGGDGARFRAEQRVDGPLVLFIGALARDKGAITLVEAMRRLWAAGSDATLALIGAPLEHFVRYHAGLPAEVRARIRLLPYAPEAVKRDALAAADVFAMPSRTDSFGIVYLEAWLYGLPVIGARAGGVPDVIDDGRDGLLVGFDDVPELAAALGRFLADRDLARRLGAAGREKTLRAYTWDAIYRRARSVYQELLANHEGPEVRTPDKVTG
jgi:glycosyltransferase involved in cell wall biosynthesis